MTSEVKFPFKGRLFRSGGSVVMIIPKELCDFLEIGEGDAMVVAAMEGKHGKFGGFWKDKD